MICRLCPRNCGEERTETRRGGVCGMPSVPVAARAMLHLWEEPCLVGERGAGCVFFSGCNLRCCFCQNKPISQGEVGKVLTAERLREIFHELIGQEAACLDLVTPTHFTDAVLEALGDEEWPVPVVWSHSVSLVVRTREKISVQRARELIAAAPGCRLVDDLSSRRYPMPLDTSDQDTVFVGRIREDLTCDNGLNIWCCGDQVRKGAATNAVQIAQLLLP